LQLSDEYRVNSWDENTGQKNASGGSVDTVQLHRSTFNVAIFVVVVVNTMTVDRQFEYAGQSSLMNVPFSVMWLNGNRYSILDNPFNIQGQN